MTIRDLQQRRARHYRSGASLDESWFRDIADALNMLPPMSVFSFGNPNSNLTAIPGTLGLNITSQATSKIWIKQVGSGNTGWASVLTSTVNELLSASSGVDIVGPTAGALRIADNTADATTKLGRITGRPYTNADGNFLAADIRGVNGANEVNYGGGSGLLNTVQTHRFYTGANPTTATGTLRVTINNASVIISHSTINLAEAPTGGALAGDAAGTAGDIAWGASSGVSYLYVCTSTNSWMRAALSPF